MSTQTHPALLAIDQRIFEGICRVQSFEIMVNTCEKEALDYFREELRKARIRLHHLRETRINLTDKLDCGK